MNDARRKELDRALGMIEEARSIVETIKGDEQAAYDNLPESFQQGERGERMEACIEAMDDIDSYIDDAVSTFEAAKGGA